MAASDPRRGGSLLPFVLLGVIACAAPLARDSPRLQAELLGAAVLLAASLGVAAAALWLRWSGRRLAGWRPPSGQTDNPPLLSAGELPAGGRVWRVARAVAVRAGFAYLALLLVSRLVETRVGGWGAIAPAVAAALLVALLVAAWAAAERSGGIDRLRLYPDHLELAAGGQALALELADPRLLLDSTQSQMHRCAGFLLRHPALGALLCFPSSAPPLGRPAAFCLPREDWQALYRAVGQAQVEDLAARLWRGEEVRRLADPVTRSNWVLIGVLSFSSGVMGMMLQAGQEQAAWPAREFAYLLPPLYGFAIGAPLIGLWVLRRGWLTLDESGFTTGGTHHAWPGTQLEADLRQVVLDGKPRRAGGAWLLLPALSARLAGADDVTEQLTP